MLPEYVGGLAKRPWPIAGTRAAKGEVEKVDRRSWRLRGGAILLSALVVAGLFFVPVPYVIYKPGLAVDVGPMVETPEPKVADEGVFMLTTVRQRYPGTAEWMLSRFRKDWEVWPKSRIFREGETRTDYLSRQRVIMRSSQSHAIQAAYRLAGIPHALVHEGVVVSRVIAGMPAQGVLRAGDLLLEIDGHALEKSEDVFERLAGKQVDDPVAIVAERDGERIEAVLAMGDFNRLDDAGEAGGEPRPGLGIQPADRLSVEPEDPAYRVEIRVDRIGGPSAGLMFALEIVDQLTEGDLTGGYRIAGTGEIDPDGNVYAIGGVKHKVSAAHREGAELFFVPVDNAEDARERAAAIGTDMAIVQVSSLAEALAHLERLPPK